MTLERVDNALVTVRSFLVSCKSFELQLCRS